MNLFINNLKPLFITYITISVFAVISVIQIVREMNILSEVNNLPKNETTLHSILTCLLYCIIPIAHILLLITNVYFIFTVNGERTLLVLMNELQKRELNNK